MRKLQKCFSIEKFLTTLFLAKTKTFLFSNPVCIEINFFPKNYLFFFLKIEQKIHNVYIIIHHLNTFVFDENELLTLISKISKQCSQSLCSFFLQTHLTAIERNVNGIEKIQHEFGAHQAINNIWFDLKTLNLMMFPFE